LIKLQRKIEAYRQVQHDTTSQLYSVSSALVSSDERTLESTLRQLNQFGYDVDRLEFVAKDEAELLDQFRRDYNRFIEVVTKVVELIRGGRNAEAREMQLQQATPLADQLERLTNQLVNKAEADMMAGIEARFGTEKALEPLRRVNAAGTHLLSLINEVLDLSKIEAGKLELNPEPVDLPRLVDEVIGTAGQLAEKNQNRLVVEAQENVGALTA